MELLQVLVLFFLLLLFLNMLQNMKMLKDQKNFRLKGPLPLVSVLIPARNEERNIKKCICSLLKQNYPHLEVIVLDDNSTDQTFRIVKELSRYSKKLKVVKGRELPPNWYGKTWACHQLSQKARGEWFLFTDADTTHRPNSVSRALAAAQKNKAIFVTCIPGLTTKTWSERLYLPLIHFAFVVLLPFKLINYSSDSRLSFSIGPFMLIKRDFFLSCGGYEAVKSEIVDDMALAKVVKQKGGKISIVDGTKCMSVRFYTRFSELWHGFSKNSYEAIGGAPHYLAFVSLVCYFLFIYPYLSLWGALESHQSITLPIFQVAVLSAMKIILALRFKTSVFYGFLHPLTIGLALIILFNSFRLSLFKKKIAWKERLYPVK